MASHWQQHQQCSYLCQAGLSYAAELHCAPLIHSNQTCPAPVPIWCPDSPPCPDTSPVPMCAC
jgi:hypothetical protein